jgi:hypothetical protein
MKYMVTWHVPPQNVRAASSAFLEGRAPMPPGLNKLGRWHAPGSTKGWPLCETDDPTALAHHMAEWHHLLELDVTPVIEDEQAGEALARAQRE